MIALIITAHVKKECVSEFEKISLYNSKNSLKEPGCLRFDILRQCGDDTVFNFYEVYKGEEDIEHHRTTEHYNKWRETVADMMAAPRSAVKAEVLN